MSAVEDPQHARHTSRSTRRRLVAEFGLAFVVVLTLVFVGLEVRETSRQTALNTVALQVTAYQDLNAQISRFNELLLEPGIALVFERMMDPDGAWSAFSEVERRQARSLLYILVRHADIAFYQFDRGMLSEERLDSALRPFLSDMDKPVIRSFWDEVRASQVPALRDYMDRRIAERTALVPLSPGDDLRWSVSVSGSTFGRLTSTPSTSEPG